MNNIKESIIFYFLSILVIVFLIPIVYKDFLVAKENLRAEQERLDQQNDYFEGIKKSEEELKDYATYLAKVETAIPNNPSVPSIIRYIDAIARNSGVILYDIGAFETIPFGNHPKLQETTFEIQVDGLSYIEVKRFFDEVEASAKAFLIEEATINRKEDEESESVRFEGLATIKTYSY